MGGYIGHNAPLFIRFVNGFTDFRSIAAALGKASDDEETKALVEEFLRVYKEDSVDLSDFKADLRNLLNDIIENGVILPVTQYLNAYMEPSILEMSAETADTRSGNRRTWLKIRDKEAPWLEAVVCYNLSIFLIHVGASKLRCCKACRKFYVIGKLQYSYCSESCKKRAEG